MTGSRRPQRRAPAVLLAGGVLACLAFLGVLAAMPGTAASAASATGLRAVAPPARTAIVLLDTDSSMAGELGAERTAVLGYARALPADVRVGLIVFGASWRMVLRPTSDRGALATALAEVRPARGATSAGVYAALTAAASWAGPQATRTSRLLVISDAEELSARPRRSVLPVDVVSWRIDSDDGIAVLRALAAASAGRVAAPARAGTLAAAFAPSGPASAPAGVAARPPATSPWPLYGMLAAVFTALFAAALLLTGSLSRKDPRRNLAGRIERYGARHGAAPSAGDGKAGDGRTAQAAVGWAEQALRRSNAERGLAERLDLAGIARKPAEWVVLGVCASAVLAAALALAAGSVLAGVLGGALIGWLGMRLTVSFRIGRRRAAFSQQLPDLLQLIAGSLQSGFSLAQALDAAIREGTQPAAAEFSRALGEARLGADLEDALRRVADRMDSLDLRLTVMAISIQREVGGNLAEVLQTTVGTMRERAYLRRQVRALSAEGRLSAYILIVLPLAVGGWFFFVDPHYMRPLYTTLFGLLMLAGSAVLMVIGVFWMRNMIDIEV